MYRIRLFSPSFFFNSVMGKGPLLPAGPGSIVRVPGIPPDPLLAGSNTSGIPVPPGGPGLILPPQRPPGDLGVSNIPGVPVPPQGPFGLGMPGPLGTPITRGIPPPLGAPADSMGRIVRGGVLPPPVHLLGPGNPPSSRPFLDPPAVGSPAPQVYNRIHAVVSRYY